MAKKRRRVAHVSDPPSPSTTTGRFRDTFFPMREVLILSFLATLVLLIYSNNLHGPFIFDDGVHIPNNPHIRLKRLSLEGIGKAAFESHAPKRPVANISFALNYYVHEYNVFGYHLVNILIHLTTGILLYLFVKTTLGIPSLRSRHERYGWIPFVTALIWLVHPIQTQSVTYIVQRMNSVAAMFYVLSLLLYARARLSKGSGRRWALFAGCTFAGILALGSKQNTATLPFFILLYEWYFLQDLRWAWVKRHSFLFLGLLFLLAVTVFAFLGAHPLEKILGTYQHRDFTLTQRVLTEFRVVIFYISLLLFPHPLRLNLDHDFPISHSLVSPLTTLLSIGAIAGFVGLAFYIAKKERFLSFCILWFFGNLLIESSVIGLEIIFEHRTYLPSMLVSLMAVTLASRRIKAQWLKVALVGVLVTVFSLWAYERNSVWSDDVTLWRDCVEKSPKKARPHNNLGVSLATKGRIDEAVVHYAKALKSNPNYDEAYYNMGVALDRQGKTDEAIDHYSEALQINPDHAQAHYNMAVALDRQGNVGEAVTHFAEALRIKPNYVKAHNNMGSALLTQGKTDEAISHFGQALRIEPEHAEAHYNMAVALERTGKTDEAIKYYSKALKINPNYAEAHYNLGVILTVQEEIDKAITHFAETLRIKPNYVKAHNNMGSALLKQGKTDEAIDHFAEALRIEPNFIEAQKNMTVALTRQGKTDKAIEHYSKVLQINPHDAETHSKLGAALARQGRIDKAIGHYAKALQINPNHVKAHYNLGVALHGQRKIDEAIEHYAKALEINPNYAEAHNNMGSALLIQGKTDEAIIHYSKALQINSELAEAHYNLGGAYLMLGDRDSAQRVYEVLKALNADMAEILLEQIKR